MNNDKHDNEFLGHINLSNILYKRPLHRIYNGNDVHARHFGEGRDALPIRVAPLKTARRTENVTSILTELPDSFRLNGPCRTLFFEVYLRR